MSTLLLGGEPAQAHAQRLDTAIQVLEQARNLVEAAQPGVVSSNVEQKFDRRLESAINLILRAMEQIETAGEIVDDALGIP
jgi:hypothetical protein